MGNGTIVSNSHLFLNQDLSIIVYKINAIVFLQIIVAVYPG